MTSVSENEHRQQIPYATTLALTLHNAFPSRYPFLLESAASGTPQGRFDILFAFPGDSLMLDADYRLTGPAAAGANDFLSGLNGWWQHEHAELAPDELPFRGGWFLFLAYELATQVEPILGLTAESGVPVALAVRVPCAMIIDHRMQRAWLVAESGAEARLEQMLGDIDTLVPDTDPDTAGCLLAGELREDPPDQYRAAIDRALRYIFDGDIFQANLSREWRGRLADGVTAPDLYRRLRRSNPGPFAGLLCWDDFAVVSSSPERLLQLRGGVAQTRPIAGTRPRSADARTDRGLSKELIGHPKERAEHVMLIDLERNDIGRICQPGSVTVDELMVIESYAHVHHIVSNVRGRLRPEVLPGDAIRAVFPGGTITGCPKVRCMEIIDELEPAPRGAYTGSMGYLNRDGSLDLNILIRTLQIQGQHVRFRAGGGIVADSDPEAELAETRAKARGMMLALNGQTA
ncbi:MAG: aminodeoxychorismate synthase component I [Gammaproteobacteria bacterium]